MSKLGIASILLPVIGLIMAVMAFFYIAFPYSFWIALLAGPFGVLVGGVSLIRNWQRRAGARWKTVAIVGTLASALWLGLCIWSVPGLAVGHYQGTTLAGFTGGVRGYLASGPTRIDIHEIERITAFKFPPGTKLANATRCSVLIGTSIEATLQVDRGDIDKLVHSLHPAGSIVSRTSCGKVTHTKDPPVTTSMQPDLWREHPATDYMLVEGEVNNGFGDSHCWMTIGLTKSRRVWVHFMWDDT